MKRFSTLVAFVCSIAFNSTAFSQQGFESQTEIDALTASCWTFNNLSHTTTNPITGNGSMVSQLNSTGEIITPFLDIPSSFTLSFSYKEIADQGGEQKIQIFFLNADGTRTKIESFNSGINNFSKTFTNANTPGVTITGVKRIVIETTPNASIQIDNLSFGAPFHYGQSCNIAPVAYADNFTTSGAFSGNIFNNATSSPDYDANAGETFSATIVSPIDPTLGSLNLNPATGAFTFTPTADFELAGSATFSYTITDNGYTPATSATVTVRIAYTPAAVSLPIKLMSFAGSINSNKALLKWSVADNETGDQFQVLRSSDARTFTETGTVFITNKPGAESYTFNDSRELDAVTYYKLKIINKDGSVSYSNVIALKSASTKPATGINIMQNPVESTLTFTYSATTATQGQVAIYNTLGVKVYSQRISSQKGTNSVSLNLDSHLAAGTYILEVVNGADRATTRMIKR